MKEINIKEQFSGKLIREGAGVKLKRYIGTDRQHPCEPILLFDFFDSDDVLDYMGGFPSHPHRGFETITYMLDGQMAHKDNQGHHGVIGPGDVQWMTAGRGIIHSEMPEQQNGRLAGLQLWLNLPANQKWTEPHYQEFTAAQLPVEQLDNGILIKVIAGETAQGTRSPITGIATAPIFFDIQFPELQTMQQAIPSSHQALIFTLDGEIIIQGQSIKKNNLASLTEGDLLTLQGKTSDSRCLLIAAKKLKEPIAWLGPFVMNTQEELRQTLDDFRNNRF